MLISWPENTQGEEQRRDRLHIPNLALMNVTPTPLGLRWFREWNESLPDDDSLTTRNREREIGTYVASSSTTSSSPADQARILLALEVAARRIALLVVRVQVLEVEDGAVLGLAIGAIELGGVVVVVTRLPQAQRRLVQLVASSESPVAMAMTMAVAGVPAGVRVGRDHGHGNVLVVHLAAQVVVSLLQQGTAAAAHAAVADIAVLRHLG